MKRLLGIFGVLVLLLVVKTDASVNSNRNFWKIPWGSYDKGTGSDDLTFDNEGSGIGEDKILTTGTHDDDEDYEVSSGDEIIELIPDDDDDDDDKDNDNDGKDDEYYIYDDKDKKKVGSSDDEDDDLFEGSGSGDGVPEKEIVPGNVNPVQAGKPTTTEEPKTSSTRCENLRKSALEAGTETFMPACDSDGEYEKVQCLVDEGNNKKKNCWCVNSKGTEIIGTRMVEPNVPDCIYGENLSTCVFQMLQYSQGLLGIYKPNCTDEGEFRPVQCEGSECWCVDAVGNEIVGTTTNLPDKPNCKPVTDIKNVDDDNKDKTIDIGNNAGDGYTVSGNTNEDIDNVVVNIGPELPVEETNIEYEEERTNTLGDTFATMRSEHKFMSQPGLLAAIIGGAVVGLLCMVLLVMFIVYRMRKKDEGSYPLDEQKYQNYSYTKAPDKEFYA